MPPHSRPVALLLTGLLTAGLALAQLLLPAPALAVNDDPVLRRMDTVLEENARLRDEAWKSRKSHDREASRQADEALNASEERLERTRAEALAHVAGVSPAQVEGLRKDGRSWGQAAGELGVHPGFLGVGKAPLYEPAAARKAQRAEATPEGQGARARKKAGNAPKGKAAKTIAAKAPEAKEPGLKAKGKAQAKDKTADKTPAKGKVRPKDKTAAKDKTKAKAQPKD